MEGLVNSAELRESFQGRRVLVTGHTGVKGSWLATWLKSLGADVTGLALRPETTPNMYEAAHVEEGLHSIIGDIRSLETVSAAMRQADPHIVFHLAAQALVRRSYVEPVATFDTNVMGTVHVLEAARNQSDLEAVVIVTSDKCYENVGSGAAFHESDPLGGSDAYSSSKAAAELVTSAYRKSLLSGSDDPLVASARAGNVICGGDWSDDRIVPDIVRATIAGEPVLLRNPGHVRPWQHVLDPLYGYLLIGARLLAGDREAATAWNFGPAEIDSLTVKELADKVLAKWGSGSVEVSPNGAGPAEAEELRLDTTRARTSLGYRPILGVDDAIALAVDWYQAHHQDPEIAPKITDQQIRHFEELL